MILSLSCNTFQWCLGFLYRNQPDKVFITQEKPTPWYLYLSKTNNILHVCNYKYEDHKYC